MLRLKWPRLIKSNQPVVAGNSKSESVVKTGIGLESDNIRDPLEPNLTSPSHSITSAKLLNKMATSLPHKVHGLEAAKAVFSKLMENSEKGATASDDSFVGGCLNALSPFEDKPHITKTIDSPSGPTLMFNHVTTPSCFSEDNEDNWQCVSSTTSVYVRPYNHRHKSVFMSNRSNPPQNILSAVKHLQSNPDNFSFLQHIHFIKSLTIMNIIT